MSEPKLVLPRVFRASDGSVAVQIMTEVGLRADVYELVRIGPELARLTVVRGQAITGEAMQGLAVGPTWHELDLGRSYVS